MPLKVNARLIICTTLAMIDHALNSSWSGYNVIAEYNGIRYNLYSDNEGPIHEALMAIIATNIVATDSVDAMCAKYTLASKGLSDNWPSFESYPIVDINSEDMAYELKRSYNLI